MTWEFKKGQFILDALLINADGTPPTINHVEPKPGPKTLFDFAYGNLKLKEKFSGKILLKKFTQSSSGNEVVHIIVDNGDIISEEGLFLNKDDFNKRKQEGFKKIMEFESNVGTIFPK